MHIMLSLITNYDNKLLFTMKPGIYLYTKLNMGFVVLVKKMVVLSNFLLQITNLMSVLSKIFPNFVVHV